MTLTCDGCGDAIEDQTRPQAFVPLASGGGVDLCLDCKDVLRTYALEPDEAPNEYPNETPNAEA